MSVSKNHPVQELCQYIPHSSSDLQEQINHRCMNDFVYKKKILMSQRKIMRKITKMLEPTQVQTRRQKRMAAVAAFLPGLASWLTGIITSSITEPTMIQKNRVPSKMFDKLTLGEPS